MHAHAHTGGDHAVFRSTHATLPGNFLAQSPVSTPNYYVGSFSVKCRSMRNVNRPIWHTVLPIDIVDADSLGNPDAILPIAVTTS